MSVATPEQVAMARRMAAKTKCGAAPSEILAGDWDNSPLVQAVLAAIIETTRLAAKLVEGFPDTRTYPAASVTQAVRDVAIATALRNGEHLKETEHGR